MIYAGGDKILHDRYQKFGWQNAIVPGDYQDGFTLEFHTPVRLKESNGGESQLANFSNFGQIIASLYWRLLMLAYFHCNPWNLDDERFAGLTEEAGLVRKNLTGQTNGITLIANHTYWQDYDRWSNRQATKMTMGGFMGHATFSGNITPYLPILRLGEYAHLGKQTMFGLGKYEMIK